MFTISANALPEVRHVLRLRCCDNAAQNYAYEQQATENFGRHSYKADPEKYTLEGQGSQTVPTEKACSLSGKNRTFAVKASTSKAYKGYTPLIRYSEEDGCFVGEVAGLNLHDISFEGDSEEAIRKDFEQAVDFYLATTDKPEKPFAGRVTLQLTPEMHAELFARAKNAGAESLDAWLVRELRQTLLQQA